MSLTDPIVCVAIAVPIVAVVAVIVLLIRWYVVTAWFRPMVMNDKYMDILVETEISNFKSYIWNNLSNLPSMLFNVFTSMFRAIANNFLYIGALLILCSAAIIILDYHDVMYGAFLNVRQSYAMPVVYTFLMPAFNLIVMLYDCIIPVWNFVTNLRSFMHYGPPIVLFKCAITSDIGNVFFYFSNFARAFFFELTEWLVDGPTIAEFRIVNTLQAFGLFIDTLVPIAQCFCRILDPIYHLINLFLNLPSLHHFLNCLWNVIIRGIQLIFATLQFFVGWIFPGINPTKPNFTNITLEACCTLTNGGDAIEDTVFIVLEMLWGLIGNSDIPPELKRLLDTHYMSSISRPVCGIVRVGNMTLTLMMNMEDAFFSMDGSGIKYLQFGHAADEFRVGAFAFGSIFYILDTAVQQGVTMLLLCIIDIACFVLEWVPGNLFFFIYAGPTDVLPIYPAPNLTGVYRLFNFLFYYFPNYWAKAPPGGEKVTLDGYTYSSSLFTLFKDAFLLMEAVGSIVALVNEPLGCCVEHFLKAIVTLIFFLANLISFFVTILTFQSDILTSARAVEVDPFFDELRYLSGCLGSLISQFGDCRVTVFNDQDNLFCCAGRLLTKALDTIIIILQQLVYFFQDMLAMFAGILEPCLFGQYSQTDANCVRIPNFAGAIFELSEAMCAFSCVIGSFIPFTAMMTEFHCSFGAPAPPPADSKPDEFPPLPIVPCGSVTSCISNLICSVLQILTVPLTILNEFFVKIIVGNPFSELFGFLNFASGLLARSFGNVFDSFGVIIDCVICAFGGGSGCDTTFYTLIHYLISIPLIRVSSSFGITSFKVIKLTLSLIQNIFSGYGLNAILMYIVEMCLGVFNSFGMTIDTFFVRLFTSLGLPLVASWFHSIFMGVCSVIELTFNLINAAIGTLSTGVVTIPAPHMCCFSGSSCVPFKRSLSEEEDALFEAHDTFGVTNDVNVSSFAWWKKRGLDDSINPLSMKKRSVLDGQQYAVSVNLSVNNWLRYALLTMPNLTWPYEDPCNQTMESYATKDWFTYTADDRMQLHFCLYRVIWVLRTDGMNFSSLPPTPCDRYFMGEKIVKWADLRDGEKADAFQCLIERSYIDIIRQKAEILWFPQDWWSNPLRKWYWGYELAQGFKIYYQFFMDQRTSPEIIVTPTYQNNWAYLGLNISHYQGLANIDDVLIFRSQYHLKDYFAWNGATQVDAVTAITTGAWRLVGEVGISLHEAMTSFGDNVTDPTVYLAYNYTADNPMAAAGSAIYSLISSFISTMVDLSNQWSDPENLKKREAFYEGARRTVRSIMNGASREATLNTIEMMNYFKHKSELQAGLCSVNETQEFMYEYELSMRGLDKLEGQQSIRYRVSNWFSNLEMPTIKPSDTRCRDYKYRIAGHSRNTTLFQKDGSLYNETIWERFARYSTFIFNGTKASAVRRAKLYSLYEQPRNHFYMELIKSNVLYVQNHHTTVPNGYNQATTLQKCDVWQGTQCYVMEERVIPKVNKSGITSYVMRRVDREPLPKDERPKPSPPPPSLTGNNRPSPFKSTNTNGGIITIKDSKLHNRAFAARGIIHMESMLDLACGSNISFFCTECFILDVAYTRVFHAVRVLLTYFVGGQYGALLNQTIDFHNYAFDPSAPARFGDSLILPGKTPWLHYDNWRIIGDDRPNKLRFNDVFNSSASLFSAIVYPNGTNVSSITGSQNDLGTINGVVKEAIESIFPFWLNVFKRFVGFVFSDEGIDTGEASASFLITNFAVCDWNVGYALLGNNTRFSIGETIFMFLAVFFTVMIVSILVLHIDLLQIITGTSISGLIFLFLFLNITYNWGWTCFSALPVTLMNDIEYFLINTLFTKCDWMLSGLILNRYPNDACYSPAFTQNLTIANCQAYGFKDLLSNAVFYVEQYAPGILQWIRDTPTPVFQLYQIPYINQRLNTFVNVNMQDADVYALYWTCNVRVTLVPHILLFSFFLILLDFFGPIISFLASIFFMLLGIVFRLYRLHKRLVEARYVLIQQYGFYMTGTLDHMLPGASEEYYDGDGGGGGSYMASSNFSTANKTNYNFGGTSISMYDYDDDDDDDDDHDEDYPKKEQPLSKVVVSSLHHTQPLQNESINIRNQYKSRDDIELMPIRRNNTPTKQPVFPPVRPIVSASSSGSSRSRLVNEPYHQYSNKKNGTTFESWRNIVDRTRQHYFPDESKTK